MKEPKPIDKTKKSNRRCINCEHYPHNGLYYSNKDVVDNKCAVSGKSVDYWNCCKAFEWAKSKRYVEQEEKT